VAGVGKGIVRELRNGGRVLVDVNGRSVMTTVDKLTPRAPEKKSSLPPRRSGPPEIAQGAAPSLDLHGNTVDEALERVQRFLNDALLAGYAEVQIIHGRSGGRLKSALHAMLKTVPSIRGFAVDARNAGMTVVRL
jgi:DNA mismatch repair protein MutS2